jgi:phage-related protein
MATFTYIPSFPATQASEPRVRKFQAGDGYEQRVTFGLNFDPKEWELRFDNRNDTERAGIVTFLEARRGVEAFDWTDPNGVAAKWVCEAWTVEQIACNFNNIRAKFRQVFEN